MIETREQSCHLPDRNEWPKAILQRRSRFAKGIILTKLRRNIDYCEYMGNPDITNINSYDFSVSIPLGYPIETKRVEKLAIVIHFFYVEFLDEFKEYLKNIPFDFDLFITTDTLEKHSIIIQSFTKWNSGSVNVSIVENRGRDIAPKINILNEISDIYDYVGCIHTKASTHSDNLVEWRSFIIHQLMGSPQIVRSIFEIFDKISEIGMIAPQHHLPIRKWLGWGENFDTMQKLGRKMGLCLDQTRALDFPSGSMFWARTAALKRLLDLQLSVDDFPVEKGQKDNTIAHAIERLFYFITECSGYKWLKVCDPNWLDQNLGCIAIDDPKLLRCTIIDEGARLTCECIDPVIKEPASA